MRTRFLSIAATVLLMSPLTATAQAAGGMGPVYQALQSQGFTNMQTVRDQNRNRIRVTAQRGDVTRELVYDAVTGKLLWDNLNPDRDRTRDRLYQQDFDQDRDRDRLHDMTGDKDQDQIQDRTRDPSTH